MIRLAIFAAVLFGCTDNAQDGQTSDDISARYGVDYAWARPSPASLRAQGFEFVARYASYDTTGKSLTHAEAAALEAAGLDVVLVWEQAADDSLSGYAKGVSDATAAQQQAVADGQPAGRPIYFAIDFDAQVSQQPAISAYFDGVASVIGHGRTGIYGGFPVVKRLFDAGKVTYGWQAYAWSYGMWDGRAQLRQIPGSVDGGSLDKDQAIADDYGQWGFDDSGPAPAHPLPPTSCGTIAAGHGLARGESWGSCDDRFELAMQTDGNLVLYSDGVALWATGTNGKGDVVVMQPDGNLVLYSDHSRALFASGTAGHAGAHLQIQDDGNAVVYDGGKAVWASNTGGMPAKPTACGAIGSDRGLTIGESLASCDGHHVLVQQADGNLVLYHDGAATWSSRTNGTTGRRAVMQTDGNFVVYDDTAAVWASGTSGHSGATLAVQDDGNLVVYHAGTALWASGTRGD